MTAAAFALDPFAVQHAALLQRLADTPDGGWTVGALAAALGRDPSNLRKSVDKLEDLGFAAFNSLQHGLTDEGRAQLDAIRRAEGQEGEPGLPPPELADAGILFLRHDQIIPNPENDRQDWDSDEAVADLQSLAADIADPSIGLLQNLIVRAASSRPDPPYMLVGGERRWRAIGLLIADGRWPEDKPIPAKLRNSEDLGHRLAALSENLRRRDLNPLEKARAFDALAAALAADGVVAEKINREIADRVGVTIEHVQQHRSFLKLDDADLQRLTLAKDDPRRLTVREARAKVSSREANKPLDLSPGERLLFAELAFASRAGGAYSYNPFIVGGAAQSDETLAALIAHKLVESPPKLQEWGGDAGHFTLRVGYYAHPDRYFDWYSKGDAQDRMAGLHAEQAAAGVVVDETYATAWLNGPFEMTDEGKAVAEALAERDRRLAANRAEQEQRREADKARYAEARRKHLAILNAAAEKPPADMAAATVEAAAAIENPLPWTLLDDGDVVDATGAEVSRFGGYYGGADDDEMTFLQLVVVSVNSAAGLPTPPIKSADLHRQEQDALDATDAGEANGTAAACRVCGCTETNACVDDDGPCRWAEPDLCSACVAEVE